MEFKRTVLNSGSISLIDSMGDDLDIVNAAKVSFAASQSIMDDNGIGLIGFLMKNKHATPFEHVVFKFHVKCPIFVAREWFRHRWSSFNEMSMRYHVPENIDFYVPEDDAVRQQVGKPGHYTFTQIEDASEIAFVQEKMQDVYELAESAYSEMLELGIAKELARSVLPVGQYTEFIWTVNLRSLLNFISLRSHITAQEEIREYAIAVEDLIRGHVPITLQFFDETGREQI